jgi:hypothetical protein
MYSNVRDVAEWRRFIMSGEEYDDRRLLSPVMMNELQAPHVSMNDPNASFDDGPFCRVADCASVAYALGWVTYNYHPAVGGLRVVGTDEFDSRARVRVGKHVESTDTIAAIEDVLRSTIR